MGRRGESIFRWKDGRLEARYPLGKDVTTGKTKYRSVYPDVLNLEEMSELLQISAKTGRRLLNNGEIRSFRIGRSFRIPKQHLISFIMGTPSEKVVC